MFVKGFAKNFLVLVEILCDECSDPSHKVRASDDDRKDDDKADEIVHKHFFRFCLILAFDGDDIGTPEGSL